MGESIVKQRGGADGSEYVGSGGSDDGFRRLRKRMAAQVQHNTAQGSTAQHRRTNVDVLQLSAGLRKRPQPLVRHLYGGANGRKRVQSQAKWGSVWLGLRQADLSDEASTRPCERCTCIPAAAAAAAANTMSPCF